MALDEFETIQKWIERLYKNSTKRIVNRVKRNTMLHYAASTAHATHAGHGHGSLCILVQVADTKELPKLFVKREGKHTPSPDSNWEVPHLRSSKILYINPQKNDETPPLSQAFGQIWDPSTGTRRTKAGIHPRKRTDGPDLQQRGESWESWRVQRGGEKRMKRGWRWLKMVRDGENEVWRKGDFKRTRCLAVGSRLWVPGSWTKVKAQPIGPLRPYRFKRSPPKLCALWYLGKLFILVTSCHSFHYALWFSNWCWGSHTVRTTSNGIWQVVPTTAAWDMACSNFDERRNSDCIFATCRISEYTWHTDTDIINW